jgi:hypothetical protein
LKRSALAHAPLQIKAKTKPAARFHARRATADARHPAADKSLALNEGKQWELIDFRCFDLANSATTRQRKSAAKCKRRRAQQMGCAQLYLLHVALNQSNHKQKQKQSNTVK